MRQLVFLAAAMPLALGCARQSITRAAPPTDHAMHVRLYQPTGGALNYFLSEPGYVAIFAVTRGHGISLVFPYYESQTEYPSHRGMNQETVHGGSSAWGYTAGARNEHRALFGYADAYYVIASKSPLPLEGMLRSPYLLRSLIGADLFRAMDLTQTWDALEGILVAELPDDAWASDIYLNWRDPFMTASWEPQRSMRYCNDGRGFLAISLFSTDQCVQTRAPLTAVPPVAELPKMGPPKEPLDRNPFMPLQPPRVGPDDGVALATRSARENVSRDNARRDTQAPAPSRPAESQPQPQPAPAESKRREPPPDP